MFPLRRRDETRPSATRLASLAEKPPRLSFSGLSGVVLSRVVIAEVKPEPPKRGYLHRRGKAGCRPGTGIGTWTDRSQCRAARMSSG